jgi:hypothetical protein
MGRARYSSPKMNSSVRRFLLIVSVCAAWGLISFAPAYKYLHHGKATAAMLLGILFIALGMHWLGRLNQRQRQISTGWLVLLFLILTTAFAVLYPLSLKHTLNAGSDREDALRIELDAVHHHQYPYDARTFLGNPPTPLPGAMLLAAPFFALGHIAWQNFLWLALFFVFTIRFFRYRATALFFFTVFLLLAPANLGDFTSGGDYLTNFFYLAIAAAIFIRSLDRAFYVCIPAALFLGVALSSRILYAVILIPLLALTLHRTSRSRAMALFVVVLIAATSVTLPIFTPHAFTHLLQQLDQSATKLRYIPAALHPHWTLPLLAVIVACTTFFVRMNFPRLFLTFSITSFVMLAPFVVSSALHSEKLRYNFSYLSVCSLAFSLWALSRYEHLSARDSALIPKVHNH